MGFECVGAHLYLFVCVCVCVCVERTNKWFIELGRLPMSNREVGGGS